MPTDTLYGIVGKALDPSIVERIYSARKRNPTKPCIILIGDIKDLKNFSISLSSAQEKFLKEHWPAPISVILDCKNPSLEYLHRGTETLAFRMPSPESLRLLLLQTGPLIAPSANTEGLSPAKNIEEAKKYFGEQVDFYLDGGNIIGKASKVLRLLENGEAEIIRE